MHHGITPPLNFATERMPKKSQREPPFTFFGTMRITKNFRKVRKKNSELFLLIRVL